jgi:hypothetical protein
VFVVSRFDELNAFLTVVDPYTSGWRTSSGFFQKGENWKIGGRFKAIFFLKASHGNDFSCEEPGFGIMNDKGRYHSETW